MLVITDCIYYRLTVIFTVKIDCDFNGSRLSRRMCVLIRKLKKFEWSQDSKWNNTEAITIVSEILYFIVFTYNRIM